MTPVSLNRLATAVKRRDMRYSIPGLKKQEKRKRHCQSRRGEYLDIALCSAEWEARGEVAEQDKRYQDQYGAAAHLA